MYIRLFKRLLDILLSLTALLVSLPIFIVVFIYIKIVDNQPVLFIQERVGCKNELFNIYKLRTMYKNSDNGGTDSIATTNDNRIIPTRFFLRKTKLDESPQFINILFGSMSVVGARPQMPIDFEKYPPEVQERIYNSRPGITGIGSVVFRNEEKWFPENIEDKHKFYRDHISPYKGMLELWYQDNISFKTDILLILLTACVLIDSKNDEYVYKVFKNLPPKPDVFKR